MDPRLAGMDPKDVFALFTERMTTLEVMQRTAAKAKRGGELEAWGLKRIKDRLDPGSSLAADDDRFMTDYAGDMVSGTALFPAMNATDCLAAVAELIEWRPKSRNSHAAALLALCRTATESAATTIVEHRPSNAPRTQRAIHQFGIERPARLSPVREKVV